MTRDGGNMTQEMAKDVKNTAQKMSSVGKGIPKGGTGGTGDDRGYKGEMRKEEGKR